MSKNRNKDLLFFAVFLGLIAALNFGGQILYFRLDLTQDQRYTMAPATKELLENLDDVVYVEVYLDGEFPAGFERLQKAIRETLEEFKVRGGQYIEYKFTDPSAETDPKKRNEYYLTLAKKGVQPTNLKAQENGQMVEKVIFPGAIVRSPLREVPIVFLKGNQSSSPEERLNQSIEGVEYELAVALEKALETNPKRIGVIQGHGELNGTEFYDMGLALKERYAVEKVELQKVVNLDAYDAIIIAKPDSTFSEPDKFKIDQFVVKGGNVLVFLDALNIQLDSIKPDGTLCMPYELNLDDLLFRWGARVNKDVLLDINSAYIPLVVGYLGDKPETRMVPWRYFPIINTFGNHPIVKNMDALYTRFIASIDTVFAPNITKTPLLMTSTYSRIQPSPVRMSFNEARLQPKPEQYNQKNLIVGVLLEGKFKSLYANRLAQATKDTFNYKDEDKPGKVLVVSDGDFVRNDINYAQRTTYPLGWDRFAQVQFANKDFVQNAVAYMLDDNGITLARNKEIQIRPLDKVLVAKRKNLIKVINMGLPVLVVLAFGLAWSIRRKKKYAKRVEA